MKTLFSTVVESVRYVYILYTSTATTTLNEYQEQGYNKCM